MAYKKATTREGQVYRYPREYNPDHMVLSAHKYRPRGRGRSPDQDAAESAPLCSIILPIPGLPTVSSSQSYGEMRGALNSAMAGALAAGYNIVGDRINNINGGVDSAAEALKNSLMGGGGAVVAEEAARIAASLSGISNPYAFQALADGEITNPLVELLYNGPSLRQYGFNWTFSPKNQEESQLILDIVNKIKFHHLPEKRGGMLKVPDVWKISIQIQGEESKFYQKFFTAALAGVSYTQDSGGNHITTPDGAPVASSLQLSFKEIKTITRDDYADGSI